MSFRKRSVGLTRSSAPSSASSSSSSPSPFSTSLGSDTASSTPTISAIPGTTHLSGLLETAVGVRPSPADGRPTTSTGTPSLDSLLAGHAGLALGNSLLIEEIGTTDYTSALLRFYAAEGVVQGHTVHVLGAHAGWARELPGLVGAAADRDRDSDGAAVSESGGSQSGDDAARGGRERMKIAWRYERLSSETGRPGPGAATTTMNRVAVDRRQQAVAAAGASPGATSTTIPREAAAFCHVFDLAKRLDVLSSSPVRFLKLKLGGMEAPFQTALAELASQLASTAPDTIHRLVVPNLLSPATYPPHAGEPRHILEFMHRLRALLRQHPGRLTAMITFPLELVPRSTGVVRSMEHIADGVLEFTPFPYSASDAAMLTTSGAATSHEDRPQGLVKIHKLPVFHERGGGGGGLKGGLGDDMAFTVSRRKFIIKPFSLPPAEGDIEAQQAANNPSSAVNESKILSKADIDF